MRENYSSNQTGNGYIGINSQVWSHRVKIYKKITTFQKKKNDKYWR